MRFLIRILAVLGMITILASGVISAVRHEEIFLIYPFVWCKIVTLSGSWSFDLLVGSISLIAAALPLLGTVVASILVFCVPIARTPLLLASAAYVFLAAIIGVSLNVIFTDDHYVEFRKTADGLELSTSYYALPIILCLIGLIFLVISTLVSKHQPI